MIFNTKLNKPNVVVIGAAGLGINEFEASMFSAITTVTSCNETVI